MTTHYQGSRGPMEIAAMPFPYASNALAKLRRERVDASRDAEIEALASHVATLEAQHAEAEAAK